MKTSYKKDDVTVLLKDVTGKISPKNSKERENLIQNGRHYSEFLPSEYDPTPEYLELFYKALEENSKITADALMSLADKIYKEKGFDICLVSLARAGTPIGILLKRFFKYKYNLDVNHYTISIIRDKGIDINAMNYILERNSNKSIQFVDGWIGKGAINKQLQDIDFDVSKELAVLSDPCNITRLFGTNEDFLIPSSILNAPVSGLFSRTILNDEIISQNDFHGAVFYPDMTDVSYEFIKSIEKHFTKDDISLECSRKDRTGIDETLEIMEKFDVKDINLVKPSIGETTRVLMRRVPEVVLISENSKNISHILRLCQEKNVKIIKYPLKNYHAVGIIKNMKDV